jgi:hypothetical protein
LIERDYVDPAMLEPIKALAATSRVHDPEAKSRQATVDQRGQAVVVVNIK